jgi:hypothetical protein
MEAPTLAITPEPHILRSTSYRLISKVYGDRRTERSGVLLINHINEGCEILRRIGASQYTGEAFCLHPLLQKDEDLANNYQDITTGVSKLVLVYAMEYRNIANAFLSDKVRTVEYTRGHFEVEATGTIKLSPLREVNDMLIADKVQNRKDFLRYHKDSHSRSQELEHYFNLWLEALSIDEDRYQQLIAGL